MNAILKRKPDLIIIVILTIVVLLIITRPGFYGQNIGRILAFCSLVISILINWFILENLPLKQKVVGYIILYFIFLVIQSAIIDIIVGAYGGLVFNLLMLTIFLFAWRKEIYKPIKNLKQTNNNT